ncbi:MAG: sigma-70 family RNA polymerase sigma factor [Bacteroidales bacterium]|nr:sigma-70 family RNA polymerase sigma factor [Bacteroidales bacterium]
MKVYSDNEILDGLKKRKRNAVLHITEEYLPMIAHMVMKMGGSSQDAEDIFQEALMAVINKLDKNELKLTASFSTYLYSVCKNLRLCQIYEQKRENEYMYVYLKEMYYPETESNKMHEAREKIFWHYFEKLSEVCKEILRMYHGKYSVKEIAEELGNTENYIRKRKYECKKRLTKLVKENGEML